MSMTDRDHVRGQYATEERLETRRSVWQPDADGRDPVEIALARRRRLPPAAARVLEVGCGTGRLRGAARDALPARRRDGHRPVRALRRAHLRPRRARAAGDVQRPALRRRLLRRRRRDLDALPRARPAPRARRGAPGAAARRHASSPSPTATSTWPTCAARPGGAPGVTQLQQRERRGRAAPALRRGGRATTCTPGPSSPTRDAARAYLAPPARACVLPVDGPVRDRTLAAGVRRPGHRLHRPMTEPLGCSGGGQYQPWDSLWPQAPQGVP